MEPRPSGPVVLTVEEQAVLNEAIGRVLSRWTAQGRASPRKAERAASSVVDYFIQSKDPTDFDGLAEFLAPFLELNSVDVHGSVETVTGTLLDLYDKCLHGNYKTVENLRTSNPQTSASVFKVTNGNDEEDEESHDDEDEDTHMNNDESTDMMVDASEHCSNQKPEAMPVADDGWTRN